MCEENGKSSGLGIIGYDTSEHRFTRAAFESLYTIVRHRRPPHWVESEEDLGRHPGRAEGGPESLGASCRLIVRSSGLLTSLRVSNDPFDVVGWDGQVWPFAFPILSFQPENGVIRLPPTIDTALAEGVEDVNYNQSSVR